MVAVVVVSDLAQRERSAILEKLAAWPSASAGSGESADSEIGKWERRAEDRFMGSGGEIVAVEVESAQHGSVDDFGQSGDSIWQKLRKKWEIWWRRWRNRFRSVWLAGWRPDSAGRGLPD